MSKTPNPRSDEPAVKALAPRLVVVTSAAPGRTYAHWRHPEHTHLLYSVTATTGRSRLASDAGWVIQSTESDPYRPEVLDAGLMAHDEAVTRIERADGAESRRRAAAALIGHLTASKA